MSHFENCFDQDEHDGIIEYLEELSEDSDPMDQYMLKEAIIHIEFLLKSVKNLEITMNHYSEQEENYLKDAVNPNHYKAHPSGIECIQVTEHMSFNLGNAIKYIWRAGLKDATKQDLEKAIWYINREIKRKGLDNI